jgi:hypothetical protein
MYFLTVATLNPYHGVKILDTSATPATRAHSNVFQIKSSLLHQPLTGTFKSAKW